MEKRTQHTSWYNETLNTATRGSRKDFPAVAVIVAETSKVTIYDGDDPDMPMWMVFNGGLGNTSSDTTFLGTLNVPISSVLMLNGVLCVGFPSSSGWGVSEIGFVSDSQRWWWTSGIYKQSLNSIDERNVGIQYISVDTSASVQLVNAIVNDVAMTVLPNAPIDPATGLPVPTIACLVGETQVTLENGETKRIDQIKVGEVVKTLEGSHKVLNWFDQGIKETIELEFDNGTKLTCTSDHKIRTTIGWIEAGDLNEEHEIVSL
jgi:hypothetical protein